MTEKDWGGIIGILLITVGPFLSLFGALVFLRSVFRFITGGRRRDDE